MWQILLCHMHVRTFLQPLMFYTYSKKKNPAKRDNIAFIFYDFETVQEKEFKGNDKNCTLHEINLCVAQLCCPTCIDSTMTVKCEFCGGGRTYKFKNNNILEKLIDFVFDKNNLRSGNINNVICIAHNSKSFDAQFILKYLVENTEITPSVIMNGNKIMLMSINNNIKFLDSLNYFQMKLAALPKAFGFQDINVKGTFPHLFNKKENQNYVGSIPDVEFYSPETMSVSEREKFLVWYNEMLDSNYLFDFQKEILNYCKTDVDILRKACSEFRKSFLEVGDTCPFSEASTIASACSRLFRKNFLKNETIGIVPIGGYRKRNTHSKESLEWLIYKCKETGLNIKHAGNGSEQRLHENILVDGYYESSENERLVYQFHGCFWHGCPMCYQGTQRIEKLKNYNDTLEERYQRTINTSNRIKLLGYKLEEIWACEFQRLKKNNIEIKSFLINHPIILNDTLNPRNAFFGGRTENIVSLVETKQNENIQYVDICSLYPYICKVGKFPIGHPEIYIGEQCHELTGKNNNLDNLEGLIKCRVLAPRDLFLPVLPVKMHNRLMFPLCRSCCESLNQNECTHNNICDREFSGTWVSDELKKAVTLGYIVTHIYEIWQYKLTQYDPFKDEGNKGGLFVEYINTFLKIKQQASGWPLNCTDESSRDNYIQEYENKEGILLNRDKIEKNPGLRFLAKLCLNSFWGKFGQRENMGTTEVIRDGKKLSEIAESDDKEILNILPVDQNVFYVNWRYKNDQYKPSSIANVVIAAYTTAQARLKLYSYLEKLGTRILYYDTDSCIYLSRNDPGEYKIPTGTMLGDMTNELESYGKNSYITSFVSAGPKFYSYIVKKDDNTLHETCKVKGFSLNSSIDKILKYEKIKQ